MFHPLPPLSKLALVVSLMLTVSVAPVGATGLGPLPATSSSVIAAPSILDRPITMLPLAPVGAQLPPAMAGGAAVSTIDTTVTKVAASAKKGPKHKAKAKEAGPAADAGDTTPADDPYAGVALISVSADSINRFQFRSPVKQILFPADVPATKPIYVAGNREVLVSFGVGMPAVAQMVAVLEDGSVQTLYLKAGPGPGALVRNGGGSNASPAMETTSDVSGGQAPTLQDAAQSSRADAKGQSPSMPAVALLKVFEQGAVPTNFEAVTPPALVAFDKFTVAPVAAWTDHSAYTVYAFQLFAAKGKTATVSAPEFYRPGVLTVDLTGDTVDAVHNPYLYIVETYVDGQ